MFNYRENHSLLSYNTFHMDVTARYFASIQSVDDLREAILSNSIKKLTDNGLLVLGGGSNILFTRDFDGLVLRIENQGIESSITNDGEVEVTVGAGVNWHEFVVWCVEKGYGGLENLSLIPGNVGSCPIQNIGAYGVEVKDSIRSVRAIDIQTAEIKVFSNKECAFGYRDSIFKTELKGKYIIVSVTFGLSLKPELHISYGAIKQQLESEGIENPAIADVSKAVCDIRSSKLPDPLVIGNAGSFFKNPTVAWVLAEKLRENFPNLVYFPLNGDRVKLAAGWLIEQCGWKGFRDGDAGVHENQALVLVNYGYATGSELIALAHRVQNSVYEKFGVKLEMEVNVV